MPVYELWCEKCILLKDIFMPLEDKEKYDKGYKRWIDKTKCPECGMPMEMPICRPRIIKMDGMNI